MSRIQIVEQEIHLWTVAYNLISATPVLKKYHSLLNPQEKEKLKRFRFSEDQHQFLVTRALLKSVLSLYHTNVNPGDWTFRCNPHGKPAISNNSVADPVMFNLAHCDGMIVLAIHKCNEIGVDVEHLNRPYSISEVAAEFFSPLEKSALLELPEICQHKRFIELWTLKESYIKATGQGLSIPLDQFGFDLNEESGILFTSASTGPADQWGFWQFQYCDEFMIAIAVKNQASARQTHIRCRQIVPQQACQISLVSDIRCSK